jgi:hypothetical protein
VSVSRALTVPILAVSVVLVAVGVPAHASETHAAVDTAPPATATLPAPTATATPTSTPEPSSSGQARSGRSPSSGLSLLSQDQANGLFDGFLVHGFERATDGVQRGLQRLVDDANLVTNTSATWTYQQPTVMALQQGVQTASNAALALVIFWTGLNVVLRPQIGGTYTEIHEVIPRLVLAAGLANSAGHWAALAIDLNNATCGQLLAMGSGSLSDLLGQIPLFDNSWLVALLLVAFLLAWVWLFLKMAWRMAMLMVLLVLAPAAQMCWALPQTRGLADRWHGKFWTTLYAQVVVTVALKLAWGFAGSIGFAANIGFNPIALLITICLLFLAANSPELLAGGAARIGLGGVFEMALLAARALPLAPAAAAAGGAAMAGAGARAAGSSSPSVAATSVPRVMASPIAVSGQSRGSGGGAAAEGKSTGLGRGGRAATSKGGGVAA